MLKIHNILSALTMLILLSACQSESLIENTPPEPFQPERKITVRATLPGGAESRAHIVYGYGEPGTECEEQFRWYKKVKDEDPEPDYITLFNVTKLDDCPKGVELNVIDIDGLTATFESTSFEPNFRYEAGDILVAFLYETKRKYLTEDAKEDADEDTPGAQLDPRKIFTLNAGAEENKPQYIAKEPDPETDLIYMHANLKMYDIVEVEDNNVIPDFYFKHLSAIFRVTLHNKSGHDIYPTKLEFKYPTTSPTSVEEDEVDHNASFFNTTLYCSVEHDENGDIGLKAYDTDDFFHGSEPYTCNIGTTINGKDGTADAGESIPDGSSYELYLTAVPRIGNDSRGDEISIHLIANHDTDNPYILNLKGFDRVIEAGKRYWFNVTATPDHKLVLTSQFNPEDYTEPSEPAEEPTEE